MCVVLTTYDTALDDRRREEAKSYQDAHEYKRDTAKTRRREDMKTCMYVIWRWGKNENCVGVDIPTQQNAENMLDAFTQMWLLQLFDILIIISHASFVCLCFSRSISIYLSELWIVIENFIGSVVDDEFPRFFFFVIQSSLRFLFVVIILNETRFRVCSSSKSTDRSLALSSHPPTILHTSREFLRRKHSEWTNLYS